MSASAFIFNASLPYIPRPNPASTRPFDKLSNRAISSATRIGFQNVIIVAACPIRMFLVLAAISELNIKGLGQISIPS